jgi:Ca-activated chloride channel family protein
MLRFKVAFIRYALAVLVPALLFAARITRPGETAATARPPVTQGSLQVTDEHGQVVGQCPLKHTDVQAEISGFLSRVLVTQLFGNPYQEKIEAVYTFPLPQNAAVDEMTLTVGGRTVRGKIKPREEARAVYEAARAAGHVAGLLDQERPNIFTQSVANIMPGEQVKITISYVETLKYEDGSYEFVFPMVVGPRYIPGKATGRQGGGWSPDTDRVPDASRITPPVSFDPSTMQATRAGHDISLDVTVDAGVPIIELRSGLHDIDVQRPDGHRALVRLKNKSEIPNRDFILKYKVAGQKVEDAVLVHRAARGGFFTLVIQPPDRVNTGEVTPKELVFVLDSSGSMTGFPIEKAKETIRLALDGLYPQDTFNLITFSGDTHILFPKPVPATRENIREAQSFLASRQGQGGTEMMKAIIAALEPSDAQDHVRIVCFMTDGYVGNDMEIVSEVQKHPNARVFSFGIGNSVNRFLLDKMAEYGRGEVEYVSLNDDGSAAAQRFHERVRNPLITDIKLDWGGLPVADVYPARIADLFSARPIIICGRYSQASSGVIRLVGKRSNGYFVREIPVYLPETETRHDVLPTLWARARVANLMGQDYLGVQQGTPRIDIRDQITQLGLEFRLMTQYTSFVAVEEMTITDGGQPRRIEVPVEVPDGVDPRGIFGDAARARAMNQSFVGGVVGGVVQGTSLNMQRSKGAAPYLSTAQVPASGIEAAREADAPVRIGGNVRPEDMRRLAILAKLHPDLVALVDKPGSPPNKPTATAPKFVRNGKAQIQLWLTDRSDETMKKLKLLGFEVLGESKTSTVLVGRIPIEKLASLAELEAVRYIAPL